MRLWRCAGFAAALLALMPSALAEIDMVTLLRQIVTANLAPTMTEANTGGLAAAVYVEGRTEFFSYGFADQTTGRKVDPDALFNVASARKVFEATLVALGTLRGELRLDDPIRKYIPELRGDYVSRVTIGQLATHTSGILLPTDHPPWPNASYSLDQFIGMLNAWTPHAGESPGKQRIYTHAGYVLLQLALERRYGAPIGELIETRILNPLGMSSTFIPERGADNRAVIDSALMKRVVQGYSDQGVPIGPPGNQQSYFDFPGTGQMFSSVRDLGIFLAACLDGKSVDPQLREALLKTRREMFRVDEKFGQAMAWENVRLDGLTVVDKPGGLNNASAYVGMVPTRRLGVVLLANRGEYPHEVARYKILPALSRL